jgi:hypothetical protein
MRCLESPHTKLAAYHSIVQPHNAVERRNDVEARLGKDTDHPPEARHESIFGDVQGEERGNKCPDCERRRHRRQGTPKQDVRSFVRRRGLFCHSRLPPLSDPVCSTKSLRHPAPPCYLLWLEPKGWTSHRSNSFTSPLPGRTNFRMPGSTSSSVSSCNRNCVSPGACL